MSGLRYIVTMIGAVVSLGLPTLLPFSPKLIWNASGSAPIGLYAIEREQSPEVTDLVAVRAPEPIATFLADGGYLPRGVPLMKRVAALPGQRVCRIGLEITVDEVSMGSALDDDRRGNPLPVWQGCRIVARGEMFLMNWQVKDNLDSRYFGPLPASSVIGRAIPLYTDEDGNGRFVWRAPTR
jgi:conjugative transfer signal peptidase TraF